MKIRAAFTLLLASTLGAATLAPIDQVNASGTQNVNPPRVCFKNQSGERLYFRALRGEVVARGLKLRTGGTFCATQPLPNQVRISVERGGDAICMRTVVAGQLYTLTGRSKDGACQWSLKRI